MKPRDKVSVHGKPFQSSLMFAEKTGAYHKEPPMVPEWVGKNVLIVTW